MDTARREFYVIIERDEDGYYVGEVPQLRAYYFRRMEKTFADVV